MAEYLAMMVVVLGQWDVGDNDRIPIPIPLGADCPPEPPTVVEFGLLGYPHFAASIGHEGRRYGIRKSGSIVSFRFYDSKIETSVCTIRSVRKLPDKKAEELGKLFAFYLGSNWVSEFFVPSGWQPRESYAALRWFPLSNVSVGFGIRNCIPSVDVRIKP